MKSKCHKRCFELFVDIGEKKSKDPERRRDAEWHLFLVLLSSNHIQPLLINVCRELFRLQAKS